MRIVVKFMFMYEVRNKPLKVYALVDLSVSARNDCNGKVNHENIGLQ